MEAEINEAFSLTCLCLFNDVVVKATNNKLRNVSSKQTLLRVNGMEIINETLKYETSCCYDQSDHPVTYIKIMLTKISIFIYISH